MFRNTSENVFIIEPDLQLLNLFKHDQYKWSDHVSGGFQQRATLPSA